MKQASKQNCKKKLLSILISSTLSTTAFAALQNPVSTDTTIAGDTDTYTNSGVGVNNGAHLTITGTEKMNVTLANGGDEVVSMIVQDSKLTADTLNINMTSDSTAVNNRPKGIIVRGNSDANVQNLNINVIKSNRQANTGESPDSDAAYGLAVGYNFLGGANSATAKVTVDKANITVSNTLDSVKGHYTAGIERTLNLPFIGAIHIKGDFLSGYQMSGIRVYRTNGAKPELVTTGDVSINVEDKSTDKINDYNVGLYISGKDAKVTFDGNTEIKVSATGVNSAGIKIGKPQDAGENATVISNGKLIVDTTDIDGSYTHNDGTSTTNYRGSGGVRLFDNKSNFEITGTKTDEASEIKASTNALVFDTVDYQNLATVNAGMFGTYTEVLMRGKNNVSNTASLRNTKLSTKSDSDALILSNARFKKEGLIYSGAGAFGARGPIDTRFQTGAFNVTNAQFTLSGEKSQATAASKGWAVYAKSDAIDTTANTAKATSELTVNLADKATLTGLIHQDIGSTLMMNVDSNASWKLAKKEDETEQRSTAKSVTLSNGGVLDAGSHPAEKYIVKVSSNGADKDGTFTNDHGIITLANQSYADKLTIEGNYVGNNGVLKTNTEWNLPGDENGANSQSDLLEITGDASGKTEVISVSKDGREKVIDGSIASIVADSHKISAPVVRVLGTDNGVTSSLSGTPFNTHPTFTGTARTTGAGEVQLASRVVDGKTEYFWTVTAVKLTPPEHEVPSLEEMPEPMPEPPVQPELPSFDGVLELMPEPPVQPELPSLDEIPQPQPQPVPQPPVAPPTGPVIITPSAVAYTLIPRQNLELGYTMLDTLHQRRGENQTLSWDKQGNYWQDVEKQSWGRVIGKHLKLDGKERFGLKTNMYGFQVGHDFDVKTKQDDEGKLTRRFTGLYFGALRSHSKFYDEYRAKNGVVIADKLTSRVKTTALNLGVTDTSYNENGTYIDWVGQLSWLNNHYSSIDGTQAKNHGLGAALSVETGRPYALGKDKTNNGDSWILEPQAQLIAQYLRLNDFNDGTRAVSQKGYGLRGRVGFRLAYNTPNDKQRSRTYYFIGNIWHDFKATNNALIGRDKLTEKFDRTWWELGLGSQFSLSENTYLYADARYEKSFNNSHKGYQGTVGVKYSWK